MRLTDVAIITYVLATFAAGWFLGQRFFNRSRLSPGEKRIRLLVREIYGEYITRERVVRQAKDAILNIDLKDKPLKHMSINLSSLARKHSDGASLAALKTVIQLDIP